MADGTRLAVSMSGIGRPLLLLHGFTGTGSGWLDQLSGLSRTHRIIAPDLLGHGASDIAAPARHGLHQQARDMVELLQSLDAMPADVLGYSMGARLALRLVVDHPGVVQRLVLESPSAGLADPAARAERRASDHRWVELLKEDDLDGFVRAWADQPMFASQARLPTPIRERQEAERRCHSAAGLAASLLGAGQGVMEPLHDRLGAIRVPTLVISGARDPRGSARAGEVAAAIPGAVHEQIATAGHTPHLEAAARFRTLVTDFLDIPVLGSTTP